MSRNALASLEYDAKTAKRAQYEGFEFSIEAPGRVCVTNGSYGDEEDDHRYTVTVDDGVPTECTCPSDEHQPGARKHRVAVAIRGPIMDAATSEPVPMPDGGTAVPPSEPPESDVEDSLACVCEIDPDGLGCFEHFEAER